MTYPAFPLASHTPRLLISKSSLRTVPLQRAVVAVAVDDNDTVHQSNAAESFLLHVVDVVDNSTHQVSHPASPSTWVSPNVVVAVVVEIVHLVVATESSGKMVLRDRRRDWQIPAS